MLSPVNYCQIEGKASEQDKGRASKQRQSPVLKRETREYSTSVIHPLSRVSMILEPEGFLVA